jgi:flagellar basal-body rod protein FlgG
MLSILRGAASGILAQQFQLDIIANNVANVNTNGYKRVRATLVNLPSEGAPFSDVPAGWSGGVLVGNTDRIFTQGKLQTDGPPWELAIDGPGFFRVQLPDGRAAYTRDGSFRVDAQGHLVTAEGYLLSPLVTIPAEAQDFFVNPDGTVIVQRAGEQVGTQAGVIRLVQFANPQGLVNLGQNVYVPSDASGPGQEGTPGANGFGEIVCQAVEGSNVDLGQEFTAAILAQRAYSMSVKALQALDEMLGMANNLRR